MEDKIKEKIEKGCGRIIELHPKVIAKCGEYIMSWDRNAYCEECEIKLQQHEETKKAERERALKKIGEFVSSNFFEDYRDNLCANWNETFNWKPKLDELNNQFKENK